MFATDLMWRKEDENMFFMDKLSAQHRAGRLAYTGLHSSVLTLLCYGLPSALEGAELWE